MKPGYKRTEIGVIPEDWELKRLAHVSAFITKGSTPTTFGYKWETDGVIFLRSECIAVVGLDLTESMFISNAAHAAMRRSEAHYGDILMTITGNVGRVVLLPEIGEANINQHIARIRINDPETIRDFVYHHLSQASVRRFLSSVTTGQAYPQLSLRQVRNILIPLPSLTEQRAIAEALSDVDGLLKGLDRLITKKRDLKQAAMQQLLTAQTRLAGFHGEWRTATLGSLGGFLKGSGVRKDEAASGEIPCVRYGEIYTHHHDIVRTFNSHISPAVSADAVRLQCGDILFAGSGETKEEIGKAVAFLEDCEAYAGGDIVILRPTSSDSKFLGYYLNSASVQTQKAIRGQGDAVVHISATAIGGIEVAIPPTKAEQTAIAEVLSDMDAELTALEARREKTRALKQAMMQDLLTGRVRLVKP